MTLTQKEIEDAMKAWTNIKEHSRIDHEQAELYLKALNEELKKCNPQKEP